MNERLIKTMIETHYPNMPAEAVDECLANAMGSMRLRFAEKTQSFGTHQIDGFVADHARHSIAWYDDALGEIAGAGPEATAKDIPSVPEDMVADVLESIRKQCEAACAGDHYQFEEISRRCYHSIKWRANFEAAALVESWRGTALQGGGQ
jgi:hypothetical protein